MKLVLATLCLMVGSALAQQVQVQPIRQYQDNLYLRNGQYNPYLANGQYYRDGQYNPYLANGQYYRNGQYPQYLANGQYQQNYFRDGQYQQQYQTREGGAPIVQYSNDLNPDGSFQYSFQTGNGISAQAAGFTRPSAINGLLRDGSDGEAQVVQGSYSYTGPDGQVYTVNYVADENGYRAEGAHLPKQPAVADDVVLNRGLNGLNGLNYYNQQRYQPLQYSPYQQYRNVNPFLNPALVNQGIVRAAAVNPTVASPATVTAASAVKK